jgi:hypothetical protein
LTPDAVTGKPAPRYQDLQIGNTGMNQNGGGGGSTLVQVAGTKTSWSIVPVSDEHPTGYQYNGFINGVQFELYLAYKDASGSYVPFGPAIQDNIESGKLWGAGDYGNDTATPEPGRFASIRFNIDAQIAAFRASEEFAALSQGEKDAINALVGTHETGELDEKGEPILAYDSEGLYLALVETGGLPSNFTQATYPQTFGIDVFDAANTRPTPGGAMASRTIDMKDDAGAGVYDPQGPNFETTKSIKNVRGSGRLEVVKAAYGNAFTGALQTATFKLYKADNISGENKQLLRTISSVSALNGYVELIPGYYFLQEAGAPANYNAAGAYKIIPITAQGATGAITDGDFTAFSAGAFIGPVTVPDNSVANTRVAITDTPLGKINIKNYWNGMEKDIAALTATYRFEKKPEGFSGDATFTVTGKAATTIGNLADGAYKIALDSISVSAAAEHTSNAALAAAVDTDYLNFSVKDGIVSEPKAGTADLTAMTTSEFPSTNVKGMGLSSAAGTTVTPKTPSTIYTVNVNHPGKGALVIRKEIVDPVNVTHKFFSKDEDGAYAPGNVPTAFSATFTVTPVNGSGDSTGDSIPVTWSKANVNTYGEIVVSLDAGLYKVQETSALPAADYRITGTPAEAAVFVRVDEPNTVGGFVYLTNNSGGTYTPSNPLADNNSVKPVFKNYSAKGKLEILKRATATGANLTGATFLIYDNAQGTANAITGFPIAATVSGQTYVAELPAAEGTGTPYWIEETVAPAGYGLRGDLVPVTVLPRTAPADTLKVDAISTNGYKELTNRVVILDAPKATLNVAKETVYPEISGLIPVERGRVSGLPLTLYKYTDGDWVVVSTHVTAEESGYWAFTGLDIGKYRVVEEVPDTHNYLTTNSKYTHLSTTPTIDLDYDAANNKLVFSSEANLTELESSLVAHTTTMPQDHPLGAQLSWYPDNLLTIENTMTGIRFAVQKLDYEAPHDPINGARFALFKKAGNTETQIGETLTTAAYGTQDGIAVFKPLLIENGVEYIIKEVSPAIGYVASPYYDDTQKTVTAGAPLATFYHKEIEDSDLTIQQGWEEDGAIISTIAAGDPLSKFGFDTTYTLRPAAAGNILPIENYTITDEGPVFKGGSPVATFTGAQPEYALTKVRV